MLKDLPCSEVNLGCSLKSLPGPRHPANERSVTAANTEAHSLSNESNLKILPRRLCLCTRGTFSGKRSSLKRLFAGSIEIERKSKREKERTKPRGLGFVCQWSSESGSMNIASSGICLKRFQWMPVSVTHRSL